MDDTHELMHQVGTFDPLEAKKVLPLLEANGIRFELEADDSALTRPDRGLQLYLGMYPEGSKLLVFVPESQVEKALAAIHTLFPV